MVPQYEGLFNDLRHHVPAPFCQRLWSSAELFLGIKLNIKRLISEIIIGLKKKRDLSFQVLERNFLLIRRWNLSCSEFFSVLGKYCSEVICYLLFIRYDRVVYFDTIWRFITTFSNNFVL